MTLSPLPCGGRPQRLRRPSRSWAFPPARRPLARGLPGSRLLLGFLCPSQRRHAALLWGDAWFSLWSGAPFPASPDSEVPSAGGPPTERAQLRRGHCHRHSNATLSPPLRSGGQEAWGWRPPADAPACMSASPVLRWNKAPANGSIPWAGAGRRGQARDGRHLGTCPVALI